MSDESTSAKPENPYSTLLTILGAGVALALVIFAIGYVTKSDSGSGGGGAAEGAVTAEISLSEFAIDGNLVVPPGAVLNVTNNGTMVHNLFVDGGPNTADLQPGDAEVLDIASLEVGEYKVYCAIPGHEAAGMVATLKVEEGADVAAENCTHSGANPGYPKLDDTGSNAFGGAVGLQYLFDLDQQIVFEVAMVQPFEDDGIGARDTQFGFGVRYQVPINRAWLFRADATYQILSDAEDNFGVRAELRRKF